VWPAQRCNFENARSMKWAVTVDDYRTRWFTVDFFPFDENGQAPEAARSAGQRFNIGHVEDLPLDWAQQVGAWWNLGHPWRQGNLWEDEVAQQTQGPVERHYLPDWGKWHLATTDRGLLLIGDPGTGKSWLAELLSAAISGNSTYVVQGTAGTTEDQIKYSWNIALVIAAGQSLNSLIPSPIMTAMNQGAMGRFEEMTRCTSDVQDALISIMSEKYVAVPELKEDNTVFARSGFNIIATANSRDRGVNDLSSALKRRFNFVHIPVVTNKKQEREIILFRTQEMLQRQSFSINVPPTLLDVLLQTFADLREVTNAATSEDTRLESSLSTAEQIGVLEDAVLHSNYFGENRLTSHLLARSLVGTLVRRLPEDIAVMSKFWNSVIAKRSDEEKGEWKEFLAGGQEAMQTIQK
jgi:hypothetical protein